MTNKSNKEHIKENKMGTMSIKRLILTMSAPIVVSMMVQSLYNVVDSIFVAQISEEAITAVSMAFPFQQLMMSVGIGTAIGVNSLLARNLGAKKFSQVNKIANNGLLLAFFSFIAFFLVGLFLSDKLIGIQTDNPDILAHGPVYLRICLMGSFGIFTHLMFERLLQATGKTMYTMIAQIAGALMNIILDPIMIFGWLGLPAMGLAGAALATVISQHIGVLVAAYLCISKEEDIKIGFKYMKPESKIIRNIYAVGIPSIIMISISSVTIFSFNQILAKFSITAVALLGIYFKLQSFIFMPVFGLNNGIIPIVGYNYGANDKERMKEAIFLGMRYAVIIMLIGTMIMMVFPDQLLAMFNASDQMLGIARVAFRIISASFVFAAISIISIGVFQAIGRGTLSMVISIIRQLVSICVSNIRKIIK